MKQIEKTGLKYHFLRYYIKTSDTLSKCMEKIMINLFFFSTSNTLINPDCSMDSSPLLRGRGKIMDPQFLGMGRIGRRPRNS